MKKVKMIITDILCILISLNMILFTQLSAKSIHAEEMSGDEEDSIIFESVDDNPAVVPYSSYVKGDLIYKKYSRSEVTRNTYRREAYYYSSSNISKKFVKYLTSSWAYSDGYSWSKTNTTSITGSGEAGISFAKNVAIKLGLSISRSTSYNTTIHIPAKKSKLSKLGFASDYRKFVYDYKYYKNGKLKKSSRDTYYAPSKNTYLLVYYK